jgi:hypothetical protein
LSNSFCVLTIPFKIDWDDGISFTKIVNLEKVASSILARSTFCLLNPILLLFWLSNSFCVLMIPFKIDWDDGISFTKIVNLEKVTRLILARELLFAYEIPFYFYFGCLIPFAC